MIECSVCPSGRVGGGAGSLVYPRPGGPGALDVVKDLHDLRIGKHACKGWHIALIAGCYRG